MPLSTSVLDMFARSPIYPIQQHMEKAQECAEQLQPFYQTAMDAKWEEATALQLKISDLERSADILRNDLQMHLPKSLFLPVARTDILEIIAEQDMMANKAKDIAGLILRRKMSLPDELKILFQEFLVCCVSATTQAKKAINELDELFQSTFRGKEVTYVKDIILKLFEIEHESDIKQNKLATALFEIEEKLPPIDVMFMYKLIDLTGELANRAQRVGSRMQLLLAR